MYGAVYKNRSDFILCGRTNMKVIYAPKAYFKLAKMDYLVPYYQQLQEALQDDLATEKQREKCLLQDMML